ncbi:MAG TPA: TonB-dependent receptor [Caulobacteraceae bacterium]|jgi:outer membrane receptor protein involved in Fe transport|nr:TonB-dependent receptor [Caulobacteraceae bacterium]
MNLLTGSTAALFGAASALALATSAFAQDAQPKGDVESVVVTATRIQTNGYTAPTPVTVAPIAQLEQTTPTTIADALNKLPVFNGSTQAAGNSSTGGPSTVYTGNFLNLRNMGSIRTLILLDGRRVPATSVSGQTDVNTIPEALVQRVDVVTGGASAVYGSDAVTGVVNYILDTRLTGLKMQIQDGISEKGDVPSFKFSVAGGTKVFDRGHFIFSAEHNQNAGLKRAGDRDYLNQQLGTVGAGTAASPYVLATGLRISTSAAGGLVTTGPFANQRFVGTGTLAPFNPGVPSATPGLAIGGDGSYIYDAVVGNAQRSDQVFGRFQYDFDNDTTGFMQLSWSESGTSNYGRSTAPDMPLTIFSGNAYLPASAQSALTAANAASFVLSRNPRDIAINGALFQLTTATNFTTGLMGKIGGFKWETYYTHGESRVRSRRHDNINFSNFYAALDAVKDPSGNIVCRVTLTNPGAFPGCQPIDMFGERNQSAAALNYIYKDTNFQILSKMDDAAASISGDVLQAWAGPLSMALNFEYRQQSIAQTSNATPTDPFPQTGVRGVPARTPTLWLFDLVGPQYGQNSVWETSAEAALPLLVDAPFAKRLDVSGAARYTKYSSSGPATTWKVGLNYQPFEDLRFRYTESRDIRAPTLSDLYAGQTVQLLALNDPHTNRTGTVTLITGGNLALKPEVARTTTLGAVYRPSWLPRFQMSVDYYNIHIANAIGALSGNNADVQRECEASNGTAAFCDLTVRPLPFSDHSAANFPLYVRSTSLNVAETFTHGVDVEASYNVSLSQLNLPGNLNFRLLYSYQPVLKTRTFPTSTVVNAAGATTLAAHRATLLSGYTAGPFSLNWQARYSSGVLRSSNPLLVYADPDLPSYMIHDLNVGYRFKVADHPLQASVSINNLFNKRPRLNPVPNNAATPGAFSPVLGSDDAIGRYYTFTLRAQY